MRVARRLIGISIAVALFGASAMAGAVTVRKDLDRKYAEIDRAASSRNVKAVFAYTTPDFTMTDHSGKKLTRDQAEHMMSQQIVQMPPGTTIKSVIVKLTVAGKKAVTDVRGEMTASLPGQDQKPHKIVATSLTRDTWVSGKAGWKLKASTEVSSSVSMDGKPFNPAALGSPHPRK
jgi:hypothetical protein